MKRIKWLIAAVGVGTTLGLTLVVAGAAPGGPNGVGRNGEPARVTLAPESLTNPCDGVTPTLLTVRIEDGRGRAVRDGTTVHFDVVYGFADPVEATTVRGEASTLVRFYPYARDITYFDTDAKVYAGDLRASIGFECRPAGEPCNPFSPPQHPMSPPCQEETPVSPPGCNEPMSPPLHPMSPPCATPTPYCVPTSPPAACSTPTPTPCAPSSPPCATPEPDVLCGNETTPYPPPIDDPQSFMGVGVLPHDNRMIVYATLFTQGPYDSAQWYICYDRDVVRPLSIERAPDAPDACIPLDDDGERILLGCDDSGADFTFSGTVFALEFECLHDTDATFPVDNTQTYISDAGVLRPSEYSLDGTAACSTIPPPPTPTPEPACYGAPPLGTPTPGDAEYALYVRASESDGSVSAIVGIQDLGGGPYVAAQWYLCYDPVRLAVATIERVPGVASTVCPSRNDDGTRVLLACIDLSMSGIQTFGDMWSVRFTCLSAGTIRTGVVPGAQSFVAQSNVDRRPVVTTSAEVECSGIGPPTPTVTPPPPTRTPTPSAAATSSGIDPFFIDSTATPQPQEPRARQRRAE